MTSGEVPFGIVIASANPDKVEEIKAIFGPELAGLVELLPRPASVAEVDETGSSLEENARLKAEALRDATGQPALADDTGLEVVALSGAPGVRSARYAGEPSDADANVAKLLAELASATDRGARFRTVALLAFPDGRELVAEGIVEGVIALAPRGSGGFGYDPVFTPAGGERTFAEMAADEKHAVSHRGRAFRRLAQLLAGVQEEGDASR